ncbi:uncharacterized protein LOC135119549 [Zophobas morio]|uniref:uncharacterized protein LOC135119549 n=1 Tax=Zophobas morio TaxID=2755281 RepID=UPI003083B109
MAYEMGNTLALALVQGPAVIIVQAHEKGRAHSRRACSVRSESLFYQRSLTSLSVKYNNLLFLPSRHLIDVKTFTHKNQVFTVPSPTPKQLQQQAMNSALPMIGFGFMDNLVMIQAGDFIDTTIGVIFGLSTLSAAALGQVVSDVSGVFFGGTIEALAVRLGLNPSNLSHEQCNLKSVKIVTTLGRSVGIILGCLLGMCSLLFMDTKKSDRMKHQKEHNELLKSLIEKTSLTLGATNYLLYSYDQTTNKLHVQIPDNISSDPPMDSIAGRTVTTKNMCITDAAVDAPCDHSFEKLVGPGTRSVLSAPLINARGQAIGVLQLLNKVDSDGNIIAFEDLDGEIIKVLCSSIVLLTENHPKESILI